MKTRPRDVWRFLAATRAYYPNFNPPLRYVLEKKWDLGGRIDTLFCPTRGLDRHQLFVTERILELPFVHRALDQLPGNRILEFGCANSQLCIELASRGMMVTGVDLRAHPLTHPNFVFLQGDFFDQDFGEESFDAVVASYSIVMIRYLLLVYILNKRRLTGPIGPLFREISEDHVLLSVAKAFWSYVKEYFTHITKNTYFSLVIPVLNRR